MQGRQDRQTCSLTRGVEDTRLCCIVDGGTGSGSGHVCGLIMWRHFYFVCFVLFAYSISISDKVSRLVDMATPLSLDADCTLEWSSVSLWVLVYPMTSTSSETNHKKNIPTAYHHILIIFTSYITLHCIYFCNSIFNLKKQILPQFFKINYFAKSRTSNFTKNIEQKTTQNINFKNCKKLKVFLTGAIS